VLKRARKVKILATLGPASHDRAMIKKLWKAGADVFRINMSHASHDLMRKTHEAIRSVEEEVGRPIAILADLQGPKLRLGLFENDAIEVGPGHQITLDDDPTPGDETRVHLPHPEILESVRPGHRLLIDDGKVLLRAETRYPVLKCPIKKVSACQIRRCLWVPLRPKITKILKLF